MARYWHNGEIVEATQFSEPTKVAENVEAKAGEWLICYAGGKRNLAEDAAFQQQFAQVFPRLAGDESERLPQPPNNSGPGNPAALAA